MFQYIFTLVRIAIPRDLVRIAPKGRHARFQSWGHSCMSIQDRTFSWKGCIVAFDVQVDLLNSQSKLVFTSLKDSGKPIDSDSFSDEPLWGSAGNNLEDLLISWPMLACWFERSERSQCLAITGAITVNSMFYGGSPAYIKELTDVIASVGHTVQLFAYRLRR